MSYDDTDNDDGHELKKKDWKIIDKMAELKEQLAIEKSKTAKMRELLKPVDERYWFDPSVQPKTACWACDVNQDGSTEHAKHCAVEIIHKFLKAIAESGEGAPR